MILVTGGAGFIGSNLCDKLLKMDHEVLCVDNLCSGSLANIKPLMSNRKFKFLLRSTENISDIEKVDFIFNLASPASPVVYNKIPLETVICNTYGVKNGLDLAVKYKSRYLHTSTSEVYGDPLVHPQREDYNGNVPIQSWRACYDESKRLAEVLCGIYSERSAVDVRLPRIFNTYGPNMQIQDGRVVSTFIVAALTGKPLIIHGDGSITRSFCYVDDTVSALIKLMFDCNYQLPVNLGNTNEFTILELAELVLKVTNSPSKIKFIDQVKDDPLQRRPDTTIITKLIGWQPKVQLEEGITKTVKYFIKHVIER